MIVVDASVILEILLRTSSSKSCGEIVFASDQVICVPSLVDVEVMQVLRRYQLRSEITPERGLEAIDDYRSFSLHKYPHEPFLYRIWELRHNLSAYDAAYVTLAEALNVPLVTADQRLAGIPKLDVQIIVVK